MQSRGGGGMANAYGDERRELARGLGGKDRVLVLFVFLRGGRVSGGVYRVSCGLFLLSMAPPMGQG